MIVGKAESRHGCVASQHLEVTATTPEQGQHQEEQIDKEIEFDTATMYGRPAREPSLRHRSRSSNDDCAITGSI